MVFNMFSTCKTRGLNEFKHGFSELLKGFKIRRLKSFNEFLAVEKEFKKSFLRIYTIDLKFFFVFFCVIP